MARLNTPWWLCALIATSLTLFGCGDGDSTQADGSGGAAGMGNAGGSGVTGAGGAGGQVALGVPAARALRVVPADLPNRVDHASRQAASPRYAPPPLTAKPSPSSRAWGSSRPSS